MGKIGIKHYDNEEQTPKKESKPSTEKTQKELFRDYIQAKYAAFGPEMDKNFRTSKELQYDCREMCEPSLPDVAAVMTELKFKSEQFFGLYAWVVYDKEPIRY